MRGKIKMNKILMAVAFCVLCLATSDGMAGCQGEDYLKCHGDCNKDYSECVKKSTQKECLAQQKSCIIACGTTGCPAGGY